MNHKLFICVFLLILSLGHTIFAAEQHFQLFKLSDSTEEGDWVDIKKNTVKEREESKQPHLKKTQKAPIPPNTRKDGLTAPPNTPELPTLKKENPLHQAIEMKQQKGTPKNLNIDISSSFLLPETILKVQHEDKKNCFNCTFLGFSRVFTYCLLSKCCKTFHKDQ